MITVTFTIIITVITNTQIQNLLKRQIKVQGLGLCLPHGVDFTLFHLNTAQEEEVRELGCECRSVYVGGLGRLSREESRNQAGTGDFL